MQKFSLFIISLLVIGTANAQSKKISFTSKEISRVTINTNYSYQFKAFDSNNNAITYAVTDLPAWLSYHPSSQTLPGKALQASMDKYIFTWYCNDGTGNE